MSRHMEHTQPAADPAPGSRAARELHSNPAIGRRYKPWFLAILLLVIGIAVFNGLLAWFDPGEPDTIDGVHQHRRLAEHASSTARSPTNACRRPAVRTPP